MKQDIKKRTEHLLGQLLDYATNLDLDEENVLVKKSILEIAINFLKIKTDEEEGSFFLMNKDEQVIDEEILLKERYGIASKSDTKKSKKKKKKKEEEKITTEEETFLLTSFDKSEIYDINKDNFQITFEEKEEEEK